MNRVATIGFFDGVHLGHQFVIRQVAEEARKRGLEALVVTFDRPPREVVTGKKCHLLTTLDEKKRLILATGADRCEILPFTPDFAALSAKDFMLEILKNRLLVEVLMLGYDNHFGHRDPDHPETFDDYQRYGREMGIEVLKMPPFTTHHPPPITHHPKFNILTPRPPRRRHQPRHRTTRSSLQHHGTCRSRSWRRPSHRFPDRQSRTRIGRNDFAEIGRLCG